MRTSPPCASMYVAGRLGVHQIQRLRRKTDGRRPRVGAEHLGQHPGEHAARPPASAGWLSAASTSGCQSISRSLGVCPFLTSQSSTVSPGEAAILGAPGRSDRRARRSGVAMRSIESRSRQPRASQSSTPAPPDESGAGSARALEARRPTLPVHHRHGQLRLEPHVLERADLAEEREGLDVAAEQDVLAVVDPLAGVAVAERRRAPAEPRARLEHQDPRARAAARRTAALRPAKPAPMTIDVPTGHAGQQPLPAAR